MRKFLCFIYHNKTLQYTKVKLKLKQIKISKLAKNSKKVEKYGLNFGKSEHHIGKAKTFGGLPLFFLLS